MSPLCQRSCSAVGVALAVGVAGSIESDEQPICARAPTGLPPKIAALPLLQTTRGLKVKDQLSAIFTAASNLASANQRLTRGRDVKDSAPPLGEESSVLIGADA